MMMIIINKAIIINYPEITNSESLNLEIHDDFILRFIDLNEFKLHNKLAPKRNLVNELAFSQHVCWNLSTYLDTYQQRFSNVLRISGVQK